MTQPHVEKKKYVNLNCNQGRKGPYRPNPIHFPQPYAPLRAYSRGKNQVLLSLDSRVFFNRILTKESKEIFVQQQKNKNFEGKSKNVGSVLKEALLEQIERGTFDKIL